MDIGKLSAKQLKALPLLANGVSQKEMAVTVEVAESTVSEWKRQPRFAAALNHLRREALEEARTRLQSNAVFFVESLLTLAKDAKEERVRLEIIRTGLAAVGLLEADFAAGIGPTDADEIETKQKLEKQNKDFVAAFASP